MVTIYHGRVILLCIINIKHIKMKKTVLLFLGIVLLTISCTKEEAFNNKLENEASETLKCSKDGMNDYYYRLKFGYVNQMVRNIHWIQQSCFKIEGCRYKIYTDPLSITKTDEANIILITHPHGDHFSPDDIAKLTGPKTIIIAPADCNYTGTAKLISLKPGQEYRADRNVKIKAVPAYNITKTQYHPKSNNWVGYLITINGVTIYHAGDTERIPEMKDFSCDIALLPLGQTYTMNSVEDAVESAKDVKAMVAIPMHLGYYEGTEDDAILFKELLKGIVKVDIKQKEQ
jgi:L-ascorbate metabolism protein UlaG (beta-lactamase superfamily)